MGMSRDSQCSVCVIWIGLNHESQRSSLSRLNFFKEKKYNVCMPRLKVLFKCPQFSRNIVILWIIRLKKVYLIYFMFNIHVPTFQEVNSRALVLYWKKKLSLSWLTRPGNKEHVAGESQTWSGSTGSQQDLNVEWGWTSECLKSENDYFEVDALIHGKPIRL